MSEQFTRRRIILQIIHQSEPVLRGAEANMHTHSGSPVVVYIDDITHNKHSFHKLYPVLFCDTTVETRYVIWGHKVQRFVLLINLFCNVGVTFSKRWNFQILTQERSY